MLLRERFKDSLIDFLPKDSAIKEVLSWVYKYEENAVKTTKGHACFYEKDGVLCVDFLVR